jgi:hypothetical protein
MKFQDFLDSCEDYEGEVSAKNKEESRHSFSWCKTMRLTEMGKQKFAKVLNSPVKMYTGGVLLLDESITQAEYNLWMEAVAGYVPARLYDLWFTEVKT